MNDVCAHHKTYFTRAEADGALARAVETHKATGRSGKSWKNLSVFPHLDHWHIGRSRQHFVKVDRSPEPPDPPKATVYNHVGVAIWITETERWWEGELRKQGAVIGYVSHAKRGEDSFDAFLDECGRVIDAALVQTVAKAPSAGRMVA